MPNTRELSELSRKRLVALIQALAMRWDENCTARPRNRGCRLVQWLRHITRVRLFAARNHFTLLKLSKVVLTAEQTHGHKNKITKKIIVQFPTKPEKLEPTILSALKDNFPLIQGIE